MQRLFMVFGVLFSGICLADDNLAEASLAEDSGVSEQGVDEFPFESLLGPLTSNRLFQEADIGIQVVNVQSGEEVYAYGADAGYVPASVMKVLTAATALQTLGPTWRFTTEILKEGDINEDGVLEGNLYVRGGGDPTLVVETVWKMVRDLQLAGIRGVDGNVIFDGSYFDNDYLVAGWGKDIDLANGPAYYAPLGALSINYNTTCIVVGPGPEPNQPARVEFETPVDLFTIENLVDTGAVGARPWMTIEREVDWNTGEIAFTLEGQIPIDEDPWRYYRAVSDPAPHFMAVFEQMLKAHELSVSGQLRLGRTTSDAETVISHRSQPIREILAHMNKHSSNIIAEHVLKAIGAEVQGLPGTTEGGLKSVADYLTSLGIEPAEYTLVNGSGLSRDLILSPTQVTAVLLDMAHDDLLAPEFVSSLSVGGQDGTLRRRFREDEHAGRVRGKTGSVNGVYCLAGYILAGDGEKYAFAFLVNGFRRSSRSVRKLQDEFGAALLDLGMEEE